MDPTQDECANCPLFHHRQQSRLPEGTEFAWTVGQFLSGAGMERFGVRSCAIELLDLGSLLDEDELFELLDLLNAVAEGEHKALALINAPKPVKGK